MRIKYQLLLTHGLLVVLSLFIIFINVATYKNMESDALIVNQAGKLRAMSYNMARLSSQLNHYDNDRYTMNLKNNLRLRMNEFDGILTALTDAKGEQAIVIRHQPTILRLEKIDEQWREIFKPLYENILADQPIGENSIPINLYIDAHVSDINETVTSYVVYSREKVFKALMINRGLLVLIIIVTVYSFISTNRRIRMPVRLLMQDLKELAHIDDDVAKNLKRMKADEISQMAEHFNVMIYDQLTKTFNRRSGLAKLSKMLRPDNKRRLKASLCFIDINGLKQVNDQLGHGFGDELIVSAVVGVKQEIRDDDFIIRMGGDEFLIVLQDTEQAVAEKIWQRIKRRYDTINEQEDRPYIISVSHGIVAYDEHDQKPDIDALIKKADDKMYAEKKYTKGELKVNIIKSRNK